jgi:hypothetical protein
MKDLDVLLADESLVLILDDTEHVWEKHRANLIQVTANTVIFDCGVCHAAETDVCCHAG